MAKYQHCDRCGDLLSPEITPAIDGGEFGYDLVCRDCMRVMESGFSETRHWLDLIRYTLPIRVSDGVELLETTSLPRWYFIRIGTDIVYEDTDKRMSLVMYRSHVDAVQRAELAKLYPNSFM